MVKDVSHAINGIHSVLILRCVFDLGNLSLQGCLDVWAKLGDPGNNPPKGKLENW